MTTAQSVSVIVITRNRRDQVLRCIESIYSSTHSVEELILVDNGSTDGTVDDVQQRFSDVRLLSARRNLLPAAAANMGIAASRGAFVLAMADDNVVDSDMIRRLILTAQELNAGIVAPKMLFLNDPNRIWSVGARLSLWTGICRFPFAGQMDKGQCRLWTPDSVHNALLFARWTLDRVGLFDAENFPIHNEEADICVRARKAGIRVVTDPTARLWHNTPVRGSPLPIGSRDFSIESPLRAFYTARNRILLVRKHGSRLQCAIFLLVFLPPMTLLYCALILLSPRPSHRLKAYLRGTLAGLRRPIEGPRD